MVGRVCMDMCMVDVTDVPDAVRPGTWLTLYGRERSRVEQAAALAGTIQYELLCDVSPRVPRIYPGPGGVARRTDPQLAPHKLVGAAGPATRAGQAACRSFFEWQCINPAAPWENHSDSVT